MKPSTLKNRSAVSGAAGIIRDIFGDIAHGLHFRMWDESALSVGREVTPITVTFTSLDSFKRVFLSPDAGNFAEVYCDGEIELDGDLFEVMKVADSMDEVELTAMQKFKIALRIWKLSE